MPRTDCNIGQSISIPCECRYINGHDEETSVQLNIIVEPSIETGSNTIKLTSNQITFINPKNTITSVLLKCLLKDKNDDTIYNNTFSLTDLTNINQDPIVNTFRLEQTNILLNSSSFPNPYTINLIQLGVDTFDGTNTTSGEYSQNPAATRFIWTSIIPAQPAIIVPQAYQVSYNLSNIIYDSYTSAAQPLQLVVGGKVSMSNIEEIELYYNFSETTNEWLTNGDYYEIANLKIDSVYKKGLITYTDQVVLDKVNQSPFTLTKFFMVSKKSLTTIPKAENYVVDFTLLSNNEVTIANVIGVTGFPYQPIDVPITPSVSANGNVITMNYVVDGQGNQPYGNYELVLEPKFKNSEVPGTDPRIINYKLITGNISPGYAIGNTILASIDSLTLDLNSVSITPHSFAFNKNSDPNNTNYYLYYNSDKDFYYFKNYFINFETRESSSNKLLWIKEYNLKSNLIPNINTPSTPTKSSYSNVITFNPQIIGTNESSYGSIDMVIEPTVTENNKLGLTFKTSNVDILYLLGNITTNFTYPINTAIINVILNDGINTPINYNYNLGVGTSNINQNEYYFNDQPYYISKDTTYTLTGTFQVNSQEYLSVNTQYRPTYQTSAAPNTEVIVTPNVSAIGNVITVYPKIYNVNQSSNSNISIVFEPILSYDNQSNINFLLSTGNISLGYLQGNILPTPNISNIFISLSAESEGGYTTVDSRLNFDNKDGYFYLNNYLFEANFPKNKLCNIFQAVIRYYDENSTVFDLFQINNTINDLSFGEPNIIIPKFPVTYSNKTSYQIDFTDRVNFNKYSLNLDMFMNINESYEKKRIKYNLSNILINSRHSIPVSNLKFCVRYRSLNNEAKTYTDEFYLDSANITKYDGNILITQVPAGNLISFNNLYNNVYGPEFNVDNDNFFYEIFAYLRDINEGTSLSGNFYIGYSKSNINNLINFYSDTIKYTDQQTSIYNCGSCNIYQNKNTNIWSLLGYGEDKSNIKLVYFTPNSFTGDYFTGSNLTANILLNYKIGEDTYKVQDSIALAKVGTNYYEANLITSQKILARNSNVYDGDITIYDSNNYNVYYVGKINDKLMPNIYVIKEYGSFDTKKFNLLAKTQTSGHKAYDPPVQVQITPVYDNNAVYFKYSVSNINVTTYRGTLDNTDWPLIESGFTGNLILKTDITYSNVNAIFAPYIGQYTITDKITLSKIGNNYFASNAEASQKQKTNFYPFVVTSCNSTVQFFSQPNGALDVWTGYVQDWSISCLLRGTKVKTPYGYKNIEDLNVGDKVLSHEGIPTNIIKRESWKVRWSQNLARGNVVYKLEKYGRTTYLSAYHKFMDDKYQMVAACDGKLKKATKEEICDENGEYELHHIQLENHEKNHLIVNGSMIVESWDGKYSEELSNNINWKII